MNNIIKYKNTTGHKKSIEQLINNHDFHILEISGLLNFDIGTTILRKHFEKTNKRIDLFDDEYLLYCYNMIKINMNMTLNNYECFLYIENYKLLGFMILNFKNDNEMSLEYILVDETQRNKNIGNTLMRKMFEIYETKKQPSKKYKIILECVENLLEYYKKYGFVVSEKSKYENIKDFMGEKLFTMKYQKN